MAQAGRAQQFVSLAALALVLVTTYLALCRGLPGPFFIDDTIRILYRHIPDLTFSTLAREIDIAGFDAFGRPISLLSLYITKFLHGNNPGAFKHENIALHLVTGLLIFWLTYRIVSERAIVDEQERTPHAQLFYATLTSAIWVAHPLSVSTVLYAVQRMTILSALFTVAALLSYVTSRQIGLDRLHAKIGIFAAVPLFSILAVLSKENAVLIPLYLLIIEFLIFRFKSGSKHEARALSTGFAMLAALPILAGTIYFLTHIDPLLQSYAGREFTLHERLATEAVIMWQYVHMLLVPKLSSMSLYHDAVPLYHFSNTAAIVAMVSWVVVVSIAVLVRKREPLVSFGILFFLVSHLLESTIFPLELMFEHRNYLASFGLFLIVAHLLVRLGTQFDHGRTIAISATLILVPLLLFQTSTRASTWKNEEHMLLVTISDHPHSDRAASELANLRLRQGTVDAARDILRQAIETPPHRARQGLTSHLYSTYCIGAEAPPKELHDSLTQSVRHDPISAYTMSSLNIISQRKMNSQCGPISTDALISLFLDAAKNEKSQTIYRFHAYFGAASVLTRQGDYDAAISAYRSALELNFSAPLTWSTDMRIKLAELQIEQGQFDQALNTISGAQQLIDSHMLDLPLVASALDRQRKMIEARQVD